MLNSGKQLLPCLREALALNLTRIEFSEYGVEGTGSNAAWFGCPRLLMPLSGDKLMGYAKDGAFITGTFVPGEALLTHSGSFGSEEWVNTHRMISVIFFHDYVRVLYIEHAAGDPRPDGPDIYYHLPPLIPGGGDILHALERYDRSSPASIAMLRALLLILVEMLEAEIGAEKRSPMDAQWRNINGAIIMFCGRVNWGRGEYAEKCGISPVMLSRIVKKRLNVGFCAYLAQVRLHYAANLLVESEMPVAKIARLAGFRYPSYFIGRFRRAYGKTPQEYRLLRPPAE